MTNKADPKFPKIKDLLLDHVASMALAFGISFVLSKVLMALSFPPQAVIAASMVVFFTIMFADPITALRDGKSRREVGVKLIVGLGMAVIIAIPFAFGLFGGIPIETATEAATTPVENPDKGIFGAVSPVLFGLLVLPLMFMAPLAEKALKGGEDGQRVSVEDLKIGAAFPVYMMFIMVLNLGVPGAMWLLDVSLGLAALIMLAAILICVAEIWMADPDDLPGDIENPEWGPRAETAKEAWAGLRKAISNSFSSALFLGSVIYISLTLALPYMGDMNISDANPLPMIIGVLAMSGVMLVSTIMLFAVGVVILVAATLVLGRTQGSDPLTIAEVAGQAQMRLLGGGMLWVRPDLEDD
ncbi:MAG: hypothetical protein AB8B82_08395 [Roseovarius sp.]